MKLQRITPKKKFSQNFLTDAAIARKIASVLECTEGDMVVEIGPGTGALTSHLIAHQGVSVYALELDERAVASLRQTFSTVDSNTLHIIHTDALAYDLHSLAQSAGRSLKVIGNLPYAITSDLLFHLYDNSESISRAVCMVQKEVAQRIVASVRTKEYGILTLATQMAGTARIHFDVPSGAFYPRPSVTSSVFSVDMHKEQSTNALNVLNLRRLVRAAFNQRRKTLRNSLAAYCEEQWHISVRTIDSPMLEQRAEELTLADFRELYHILQQASG